MNKTLRILFLTGLAAIFCASCSKVEEILPESYQRNDKPFSVEKVPVEGGTITLYKVNGEESILLNLESTSLSFSVGDTLLLTATAKTGYTFINWKRDGVEKTTEPSYKFCLDGKDVDENGHVKYHFEARFGIDYAIQSIPSIDEVMPEDLIAIMGSHLNFGDNPPNLFKMSVDTTLGFYSKNPILLDYYAVDSSAPFCSHYFVVDPITGENSLPAEKPNWDYFLFHDQHRGIAQIDYKCLYLDETYNINGEDINIRVYDKANTVDSVFIMGNSSKFTAYFHQFRDRVVSIPENSPIPVPQNYPNPGSHEAMIISGEITDTGVKDVYFGIKFLAYDNPGGEGNSFSKIGDIIVFHYDFIPFGYWNPNN